MTGYINIDGLCWEIQACMESNYTGTPTERFNETKEQLVESFKQAIEDNREGEIKEFKGRVKQ